MEVIFLNDVQRKRIVNLVKPDLDDFFTYQNLDMLTAVSDPDGKFVLTMVYYLSSCITRTDDTCNECRYVLLTDSGDYFVSASEQGEKLEKVFSPLPGILSHEELKSMVQYYQKSISRRLQMQRDYLSAIDIGDLSYTEWYLRKGQKKAAAGGGFSAMLHGMAMRLWRLITFRKPPK